MTRLYEYDVSGYGRMIADEIRMRTYSLALRQAVGPDSIVLDIGAGTGILGLLACKFGARKAYLVEPSDVIQIARDSARANGFADRIECIQGISTEIHLDPRPDIVVSDLYGVLPLFQQRLPALIDASRRLLAPGGVMIPKRDTLWVAVVEAPEQFERLMKPWRRQLFDLNLDAAANVTANLWQKTRVRPEQVVTEPYCWATIDLMTAESVDFAAQLELKPVRRCTAHGFIVWFDCMLADGIEFSNAPSKPEMIYGSGFFPWLLPVQLTEHDTVAINLRADLVGADYVWTWDTRVYGKDPKQPRAQFHQSTFLGACVSPARLSKRRGSFRPKLTEEGEIDLRIVELMDGMRSIDEIAEAVQQRFPQRFPSRRDVLTKVGDLAGRYSL